MKSQKSILVGQPAKQRTITLSEIAVALHGDLNGKWINIRGPGHSSSTDRSCGFLFDPRAKDGFRLKSFADDDPATCRAHVRNLLGKITADGPLAVEYPTEARNDTAAHGDAVSMKVWNEAVPAQGTLVEAYLAARGCKLTEAVIASDVLRFHPLCPFGAYRVPAMVALMRDAITGDPTGVHRTALMNNGSGKRIMPDDMPAKMMLGRAKGAAVMPHHAAPRMGIAEGIVAV